MTKTQVLKVLTRQKTDETKQNQKYNERGWANSKIETYGLEVLSQNKKLIVTAKDQVILSSGAVSTPHILQVSGIGSKDLINKINVEHVHELPGVGENLQDHLQIRTVYKVSNCKTVNTMYRNIFSRMNDGIRIFIF